MTEPNHTNKHRQFYVTNWATTDLLMAGTPEEAAVLAVLKDMNSDGGKTLVSAGESIRTMWVGDQLAGTFKEYGVRVLIQACDPLPPPPARLPVPPREP